MGNTEYLRRDLIVEIDRSQVQLRFNKQDASLEFLSSPEALAAAVAASPLWKDWATISLTKARSTLSRICLDIRALDMVAKPWERDFAGQARLLPSKGIVVRSSPVRPRCANFLFGTPLRVLRVNSSTGKVHLPGLDQRHRGKPLTSYEKAFVTADTRWRDWSAAAMPQGWPNIDVLHIDRLPTLPRDPMSTDAGRPGTLGWFVSQIVQWQVRLLVVHTSYGRDFDLLCEYAAAVVARGGPAIVLEAFPASQRQEFYRVFYRELIHDRPVDWMWSEAWEAIGHPTEATLFVGATREEQIRVSRLARKVPAEPVDLKIAVPAKWPSKKMPVAFKSASRFGGSTGGRTLTSFIPTMISPTPILQFASHVPGAFTYAKRPAFTAADFLNFGHESTLIKLGGQISKMRKTAAPIITVEEALSVHRPKNSTRFCNTSFWKESAKGKLIRIDQSKGSFVPGIVYQLAVQIGPKDLHVVTVNEQAFVPEVIKWTPEMQGVWIEVGVTGIDFNVVGDPVQRLWLPREGPSEVVYFALIPRQQGTCRLRFALYYEQNVVQSFRVAAVVGQKQQKRAEKLARALGLKPGEVPNVSWLPMLEFSLARSMEDFAAGNEATMESRALSILANDWDGEAIITVKGASGFDVHISNGMSPIVDDLRDNLVSISGLDSSYPFDAVTNEGDKERLESVLRSLADYGSKLFTELIDGVSWMKLQEELEKPDQVIQVSQVIREKVIPWAFVYGRKLVPRAVDRDEHGKLARTPVCLAGLPDADGNLTVKECGASPQCLQRLDGLAPENVICPLHFWGFRHGIEIPPLQVPKTSKMPNQTQGLRTKIPVKGEFRLVAGLNAEFETQSGHMRGIEDLKRKIACMPIPEFHIDLLLKELAVSPIHIAYFFCHATGGKGSSDSALILQAPGSNEKPEWLPWNDIAQSLVGKLSDRPALVFLNGCRTAAYRPDALSPFIRVFVDQAGASGLIGTEISVWDVFAAEIAEKFLREFLDCKPAGPALLKARRAMLAKKNPLGLVYTLFAWNDLKLVADA